jgi:hypothetical protein
MDFTQLFNSFSNKDLISLAFKAFFFIFSILYLLYAIVIKKQTEVLNKALESQNNQILFIIASLQITAGLILVILAIFLI